MRATASVALPAVNGTTARKGLFGQPSAGSFDCAMAPVLANKLVSMMHLRQLFVMWRVIVNSLK